MSFVTARPEAVTTAAGRLDALGSAVAAQNAATVAVTARLPAAAADEVSTLTATQFGAHAAMYQAVGAHAMAVQESFLAILRASADSYAATETANTIAAG